MTNQQKQKLHELMPESAAFFNAFWEVFGHDVKLTYAEENGIVRGALDEGTWITPLTNLRIQENEEE